MNQPIPGDNAQITSPVNANWQKTSCSNVPPHFTVGTAIAGTGDALIQGADGPILMFKG